MLVVFVLSGILLGLVFTSKAQFDLRNDMEPDNNCIRARAVKRKTPERSSYTQGKPTKPVRPSRTPTERRLRPKPGQVNKDEEQSEVTECIAHGCVSPHPPFEPKYPPDLLKCLLTMVNGGVETLPPIREEPCAFPCTYTFPFGD
jgi:hypothetical protein